MPAQNLQGMRVAILATDGVEMAALAEPRKALEESRAKTTLIAPKSEKTQSMKHHDKATEFDVGMTLNQANPPDFDAVLLPGGALNADALRVEPQAQKFVSEIDESGKPLAVICHAPWLLV